MAGATGRLGARVVRELLAASPQLRVRAGVRNPETAAGYLQTAVAYGLLPPDAARRVQLVPADLTQPDSLPDAIGNASRVRGVLLALQCPGMDANVCRRSAHA